jgi:hypothetical protein
MHVVQGLRIDFAEDFFEPLVSLRDIAQGLL